ncbi:MAG: hypothetical protein QOI95_1048 [Acidimicrobiaceae bacterium]|jgi:hypothetical protein
MTKADSRSSRTTISTGGVGTVASSPHEANPFERVTEVHHRPRFVVEPATITWDAVAFRLRGERDAVACVPRRALAGFFVDLDGGKLDEPIERFLASPASGRVLSSSGQTSQPGLFDELAATATIAPPERGPGRLRGFGRGGGTPAEARRNKRSRRPRRLPVTAAVAVVAVVATAAAVFAVTRDRGDDKVVTAPAATTPATGANTALPVPVTQSFSAPGTFDFVVPAGVTTITVDAFGAAGGKISSKEGGLGGRATATIAVTPGETLQINVGGAGGDVVGKFNPTRGLAGINGGGTGGQGSSGSGGTGAGGGGGASDVRQGGTSFTNRVVVAGGGGGAAPQTTNTGAGAGGGLQGTAGATSGTRPSDGVGGGAGTQTSGGSGGGAGTTPPGFTPGLDGTAGTGGTGGDDNGVEGNDGGGGGGGGWFGGGGGGGGEMAGAGGGGSGHGPAGTTFESGVRAGDGMVTLSFSKPG